MTEQTSAPSFNNRVTIGEAIMMPGILLYAAFAHGLVWLDQDEKLGDKNYYRLFPLPARLFAATALAAITLGGMATCNVVQQPERQGPTPVAAYNAR